MRKYPSTLQQLPLAFSLLAESPLLDKKVLLKSSETEGFGVKTTVFADYSFRGIYHSLAAHPSTAIIVCCAEPNSFHGITFMHDYVVRNTIYSTARDSFVGKNRFGYWYCLPITLRIPKPQSPLNNGEPVCDQTPRDAFYGGMDEIYGKQLISQSFPLFICDKLHLELVFNKETWFKTWIKGWRCVASHRGLSYLSHDF